jgi:hypothetical protein
LPFINRTFMATSPFLIGGCDKAEEAKKAVDQATESGKSALTKMMDDAKKAATDQLDKLTNWNKKPSKDGKSESAEPGKETEQTDKSSEKEH